MGLKIEEWHLYPILRDIDDLFQLDLITETQALDLKRVIMKLENDSLSETSILHIIKNLRKFKRPIELKNNEAYKTLIDEEIISGLINKFRVH
jgi:hypothetical protein